MFPAHEVVFTRESMVKAAETLRKQAEKRVAQMQKAGEEGERVERLQESAEGDITRLGQAAYFAGIERYLTLLHPDAGCAADYLPADILPVFDEAPQMRSPRRARCRDCD